MPKKNVQPPQNNAFALQFDIENLPNGKVMRKEMAFSFDSSNPELIKDDKITERGFRVLLSVLTDAIENLAETAEKTTRLKAKELRNSAAARLEVKEAKRIILNGHGKIHGI